MAVRKTITIRITLDEICKSDDCKEIEGVRANLTFQKHINRITDYLRLDGRSIASSAANFKERVVDKHRDVFSDPHMFSDWQLIRYVLEKTNTELQQRRVVEGMEHFYKKDKMMIEVIGRVRSLISPEQEIRERNIAPSSYFRFKKEDLPTLPGKVIKVPSYTPLNTVYEKSVGGILEVLNCSKVPVHEIQGINNVIATLYSLRKGVSSSQYGITIMANLGEVIPFAQAIKLTKAAASLREEYNRVIGRIDLLPKTYVEALPSRVEKV